MSSAADDELELEAPPYATASWDGGPADYSDAITAPPTAAAAAAEAAAMATATAAAAAANAALPDDATAGMCAVSLANEPAVPVLTPPTQADGTGCATIARRHILELAPDLGAAILSGLSPPCFARLRRVCHTFEEWSSRAAASLQVLHGTSFVPHDLEAGMHWLVASGVAPSEATFERDVTDDALSILLQLAGASLRTLKLNGSIALTDRSLGLLASHSPRLMSLALVRCASITPNALVDRGPLRGLTALQALDLTGCPAATDDALAELADACPTLEELVLQGCRAVTCAGVACIARLHSLTTLDLGSCVGLTRLDGLGAGCQRLTSLSVALCKGLGDTAIGEACCGLAGLQRLNLTGTAIGDTGVAMVAQQCPDLRWFNCTRCLQLGDDGAIILALKCAELTSLYLARCTGVSDTALEVISEWITGLRELHLAGCAAVSDRGIAALAAGCSELRGLYIDTCAGISDDGIVRLALGCSALETLQANGCAGVGDEGLSALAQHCPQLNRIDVRGCARVTEESLSVCTRLIPRCKVYANAPENR